MLIEIYVYTASLRPGKQNYVFLNMIIDGSQTKKFIVSFVLYRI